jgi:hypothetical protein
VSGAPALGLTLGATVAVVLAAVLRTGVALAQVTPVPLPSAATPLPSAPAASPSFVQMLPGGAAKRRARTRSRTWAPRRSMPAAAAASS